MAALSEEMDAMVSKTVDLHPYAIAVNTRACADTFRAGGRLMIMGKGIDVSQYQFVERPVRCTTPKSGRGIHQPRPLFGMLTIPEPCLRLSWGKDQVVIR
jgi:hypothetical protein